jgi:PBP1b-binding outer membrane lipoprotein LpoB
MWSQRIPQSLATARPWRWLAGLLLVGCALGCASVNDVGGRPVREIDPSRPGTPLTGTGPESQDVLAIADKMMRSLLGAPVIANAVNPPTVVLLDFRNRSRFAIDTNIFLRKLRVSLNSRAGGRMIFLGRERMDDVVGEREAKRAGTVSVDPTKQHRAPAGADYFLTGNVTSLSKSSRSGREDYLLYVFSLIDAESSAVVWEDEFEIKRVGQDDAVYR